MSTQKFTNDLAALENKYNSYIDALNNESATWLFIGTLGAMGIENYPLKVAAFSIIFLLFINALARPEYLSKGGFNSDLNAIKLDAAKFAPDSAE